MNRLATPALAGIVAWLALGGAALAQSNPCFNPGTGCRALQTGDVPSATQWNSFFAAKQDALTNGGIPPAWLAPGAAAANLGVGGITGSASLNAQASVPTNAALQALSTATAQIVIRLGVNTPGDAPPLVFVASSSACSLNSGNGDTGTQVKSADGKCWVANYSGPADVREWGAIGDGSTDNTATINTAIANAPGCATVPATTLGFYVAGTIINNRCLRGIGVNPVSPTIGYAGQSWIKCNNTIVNQSCLQVGGTNNSTNAPVTESIVLDGSGSTPASGSIGYWRSSGFNGRTRDLIVVNFDTCAKYGPVNSSSVPITEGNWNLTLGFCQTHYVVDDGMPELTFIGGRWGLQGADPFSATTDFLYVTNTGAEGSGGGPNTVALERVQLNESGAAGSTGAVGCAFNFGGWTGSGGVQSEFKITDSHIEWHNAYSGGGTSGIFCSDSTVPAISMLQVKGLTTVTPVTVPVFAINAATNLQNVELTDNYFNTCGGTTLFFPTGGTAATVNSFKGNHFCTPTSLTGDTSSIFQQRW